MPENHGVRDFLRQYNTATCTTRLGVTYSGQQSKLAACCQTHPSTQAYLDRQHT